MDTQAAIERIRKLMSYKVDGSNACQGEIENALGHARRLMEKFNLDMADIQQPEKRQTFYDEIKEHEVYQRANAIDIFDRQLGQVACIICDVKAYTKEDFRENKRGNCSKVQILVFYGHPRDCAVAQALYMELLATMRSMIRFRFPNDWQQQFSSYCYGFVNRLLERARQLKEQCPAEAGTTAIVVRKEEIIKQWAQNNLQLTRSKNKGGKRVNGSAYAAGSADGSRVHLGTNSISGEGQRRLT